ncbi:MAG: ATP-binding protein [Patescibacteria group bacterium]|nr:ATP-binding protein [Patescibacteria group bacterium]
MQNTWGKKLNIISLIVGLIIPPVFLFISLFVKEINPSLLNFLRVSSVVGALCIVYFFFFNKLYLKSPKNALIVLFGLNFLYVFALLNITGGISSPLIFVLLFLTIAGFYVSNFYGLIAYLASMIYFIVDIIIYQKYAILLDLSSLTPRLAPIVLIAIPSYLIGERYRKSLADKAKMIAFAEKLSSDKSQEEAVFSSIADGVYAVDTERNVVLFNKAAEEMTGWEEKAALGIKCWTVMKLKNEQDVSICEKDCPVLQVWNSGENVVRDDLCFVNKSKKNIQISAGYSPIKDISGNTTGAICVFRDVTKQKEVERLRNEFVSTASHELRTPITTLEGYISLASNEKITKIDNKAREYLDKAHAAIIGMSTLVRNLLSVTKIEEGKLEVNIEKFEINSLIEQVVGDLTQLAKKKEISLEFEKSKGVEKGKKSLAPPIRVVADQSMIREVLTNLIENGIKFTMKGGVKVNLDQDKDFAIISVEDTGMGIPKESLKHLFEKFYRVDNSATREVGGTGLGLFITRSIVEQFGGKIWVESEQGKGSKFTFTIPKSLD